MTSEVMTREEAQEWAYCEKCGQKLEERNEYRYSHTTGEAYIAYSFKKCPVGFDSEHTTIDLISQADLDEARSATGWGDSEIREAPRPERASPHG